LIDEGVLALIGAVGTPTSVVAQPVATTAGVPFIGAYTGAEFLRAPELRSVINVRGSYYAEAETWIERLTTDLDIKDIAILYQNDAFGQAGLKGVQLAMDKRGMRLAAEATYERNTIAVEGALETLRAANPKAVVMVGAYKPLAEFVRQSRRSNFDPVFISISFVGADAFAADLGKEGAGVVVTQVVPFPWFAEIPLVGMYQADLKKFDGKAEPGFVSLEGYMVGQTVIEALRRIQGEPTREKLVDAIYEAEIDLGGATLVFGPGDNQGMDKIYITVIDSDGVYQPVRDLKQAQAIIAN
jgi:branched-chain amino acid transport system substrate-binding protein